MFRATPQSDDEISTMTMQHATSPGMRCLHVPSSNRTSQKSLVPDISPTACCSMRAQVTTPSPRKNKFLTTTCPNVDINNQLSNPSRPGQWLPTTQRLTTWSSSSNARPNFPRQVKHNHRMPNRFSCGLHTTRRQSATTPQAKHARVDASMRPHRPRPRSLSQKCQTPPFS